MTWRDAELWIGRSIWDEAVPTPFVFVDLSILQRNIAHMQALAQTAGVSLRPHIKTHKIAAIAQMQLQAGAAGLTVAKLGEAHAFVDAGIRTSYMVAQPFVGAGKVRWALRLGDWGSGTGDLQAKGNELLVCVDSVELAEAMNEAASQEGATIDLVLIVDTGYQRFGVDWRQAAQIAGAIARLPHVRFRGIRSHDGRPYRLPTPQERFQAAKEEAERMAEVADQIRQQGIPCEIVSIGSTPGAYLLLPNGPLDGVTEVRPGNYVFHDRMQVSLGVAKPDDCALRIIASIVSTPRRGEALMDAGLKTLTGTQDRFAEGFGLVLHRFPISRPAPPVPIDAVIEKLWEECGLIRCESEPLRIGDRIAIVPNHACEITNLAEVVFYGTNDCIDGFWVPEARAKVW